MQTTAATAQLLEKFIQSRPNVTDLSEEDIMNEVRAVRYTSK